MLCSAHSALVGLEPTAQGITPTWSSILGRLLTALLDNMNCLRELMLRLLQTALIIKNL